VRTFDKKSRFQVDSLPEIRRGLDQLAFELKSHQVGNRTVSEGHIANAAILVILAMPRRERHAALLAAFAKFNALLALDFSGEASDEVDSIIHAMHSSSLKLNEPSHDEGGSILTGGVAMPSITDQPTNETKTGPRLRFDENGHAIPFTEEERRARTASLQAALAAMAAIPDDPPGSDEEFWRAIDEGRPDRPLFREYYAP
jgi:hypothetical protein